MLKVKEVIVVEGRYDKNTLSQVVDAHIIETSGFSIFNDEGKRKLLRTMAEARGLVVLTDSDGAGFVIRNYIKGCVDPKLVKHAYIPDVYGKERRKAKGSKEGRLGVEGMKPEVLLDALRKAGATIEGEEHGSKEQSISKADMFARGLSGRANSSQLRGKLLKKLDLPGHMTADGLLDVLNIMMDREQFYRLEI